MGNSNTESTLEIYHLNATVISTLYHSLRQSKQLFNILLPMPKHIADCGTAVQRQWCREHWSCEQEAHDIHISENTLGARDIRITFDSSETYPEMIYQHLTLQGFIIEAECFFPGLGCSDNWSSASFLKDYKEMKESEQDANS